MRLVGLGIARGEGAPEHAAHVAALEQGQVERQPGNAGGKADHEVAAFPADRSQRGLGIIAADRIVYHVIAAFAAGRLELVGERLRLLLVERRAGIDDRLVRARLSRGVGLFLRGDRGDDARAIGLAELDRGEPHAAGRAEHQQAVTRLQMAAIEQSVDCRCIGKQQRSALGEAAALGQRVELCRVYRDLLDQPAMADHADHPVAALPAGHAVADAFDHAGDLAPRRERPGRLELVFVLDDQDVGIIDRTGLDRDHDLPRRRHRIGQIVQT